MEARLAAMAGINPHPAVKAISDRYPPDWSATGPLASKGFASAAASSGVSASETEAHGMA